MRPLDEQHKAAARAWMGLKAGRTLHDVAHREGVGSATLDRWIWSWRRSVTQRPMAIN